MYKMNMQKMTRILLIQLFILTVSFPSASAQRTSQTINNGWQFSWDGTPDSTSERISLPHTWNTDAYTHKAYRKGMVWYSRSIQLPQSWNGKQVFITFEGANKWAKVFVNDQLVGEHSGGYTAFTFDITPFCSCTSTNTLSVCVDNAREDIPPISGDFTFFGGIYRDVWITAVSKQHFNFLNHGSSGIFIRTPQVSENEATLEIRAEIKNDDAHKTQVIVETNLYSPENEIIQTEKKKVTLEANQLNSGIQTSFKVKTPQLWSPETPQLYRVETLIREPKTNEIFDRLSHKTGFRWVRFDAQQGFFLNGKSYKLRGVCRHQDQKPIGVALTDEMHRRDIQLIKDMGANFIRISHYPQDAAVLEMCDELGLLAWEEIPVIDIVPESEAYAETCELNLREMIRQHYNHPSIILWGYMNEILLVTQRRNQGEALKTATDRAVNLAKRLENVLKTEDSNRTSVMAFHGSNSYNEVGLSEITDVVGWNLYQGWYGGDVTGFDRFVDEQKLRFPNHPMIVSEYGAGSDRRVHTINPKPFDFSIDYQQFYLEHYLPVLENRPFISGGAHWNFIDFSSALRDESMPRINNKGLVYADRSPKDVYFYFKALWRTDIPVLHIASRDWSNRAGIQINNTPVVQPVKVYSNLNELELFLNGHSLGKKKTENCVALFDVPFTPGEQFIRATGTFQNQFVEDGMRIQFTAIPSTLNANNIQNMELAVNVGSHCFFTDDQSQLTWIPDRPYEPGGWGYLANETTQAEGTQAQIEGTANNPLFQTLRSNLNGYRFDVPVGQYEVELLFADIFKTAETSAYLLGKTNQKELNGNAFEIRINNQLVEEAFCPTANAGMLRAIKKRYIVQVKDRGLEIQFKILKNKSFLNGIKLRKL